MTVDEMRRAAELLELATWREWQHPSLYGVAPDSEARALAAKLRAMAEAVDPDREASLREDADRLDALEAEVLSEALLLHNSMVHTLGCRHRGLGLLGGRRTLRQAIDSMRRAGGAR